MKKGILLLLMLMFAMPGCDKDTTVETNIYFLFAADQITCIEMYHYVSDPSLAEKKVITEKEEIRRIYIV